MNERERVIDGLRDRWGDCRLLSFQVDDASMQSTERPNVRWHMIALEGEWKGHWMGAFRLDSRTFDEIVSNFEASGIDVVVDYEHNSLNPFAVDAPASAWIDQMQRREAPNGEAQLWARFAWTPRASKAIDDREYRYLSPVIRYHTPDRVTGNDTGASVPSVGLTNQPFLHELPEVTINSMGRWFSAKPGGSPPNTRSKTMDERMQAALAVALGLDVGATPDQMVAAARDMAGNAGEARHLEAIAAALDVEPGTGGEQLVQLARAIKGAQVPAEELARLRQAEQEAAELRVNTAIDAAKAAGKLTPAMEPWARQLAQRSLSEFSDWVSVAPEVVPQGRVQQPAPQPPRAARDEGSHDPVVRINDAQPPKDDPRVQQILANMPADELQWIRNQNVDPADYVRFSINDF